MITRISDWGGCTPLTGENNYSRNPLTGSYPDSSKKRDVSTSETQGICNFPSIKEVRILGVSTSETQGLCNWVGFYMFRTLGVSTSELSL